MEFEITPEQLKTQLDQKLPVRLVDVREPWEFQISHIAGSVPLPMADIPARANRELDPDEHIVVICHHGVRSANVTHWLRQQGFENTQSLVGGIDRWSRLIDSAVPVY
jgi:rhodanese-related sulfurtransferase